MLGSILHMGATNLGGEGLWMPYRWRVFGRALKAGLDGKLSLEVAPPARCP